jgi:histidinol-phosphate aminotransferase
MTTYDKPPELYDGLRLHQNEHTGGCSPRVLDALSRLRADAISVYPPYSRTVAACAAHLGLHPEQVALVNGMDEGILALAVACLQRRADGTPAEVIVPQPAFEVFEVNAHLMDARVVTVAPGEDFAFAQDDVLAAIGARTRLVILTNPNNPTGVPVPLAGIRAVAAAMRDRGLVLVDEAYVDFGGDTFVPELDAHPNVIVGRTFSKAYGLAGLRIGLLAGHPATLAPIQRVIPVYSINVAAAVAAVAALEDRAYTDEYLRQVAESKAALYAACDRWGLTYWPSAANFVLVRTGEHTRRVLEGALGRGIYLRDRSSEPGCAGCIRITTGLIEHTRLAIAAIEEVLCGGR